jgi:small multidrug resistance pump
MALSWFLLFSAIIFETLATTSLKLSNGLSRPLFLIPIFLGYGLSFLFLSQALRSLQVGIAYAIWSAVGTAIVALIGIVWLHEPVTALKLISLILVIVGVIGLYVSANGH